MRLQRGDRFERFLVKEALGSGARGELYHAADEKLARDVALRLFVGDAPAEMLVAAARKAASLDHPNVAATYDVGTAGETPYAVREFVRGSTLRARLDAGVVPITTCAEWIGMIASALEAAHALGLIHGALTADSIVLSDDAVKVLEFSRVTSEVDPSADTMTLTSVLEPMRADVRAWGALAEELLTATRDRSALADSLRALERRARESQGPGGFASMSEVVAALADATRDFRAASTRRFDAASTGPTRLATWARIGSVAAAILVLGLGAGLVARGRREATPVVDSGSVAPIAPSDSRMSANPQATGAYRAGLQAARDGALDPAFANLDRAIALDPAFAAAHLRRAILYNAADSSVRPSYETAARLRADLGSHDRTLLDAYEPATHAVPDLHETELRLVAALAREPHDADFAYNLAKVRLLAGDYAGAARACDAASAEDPGFAGALQIKGFALLTAGDVAGGLAALDACIARSPVATSCLAHKLDMTMNEGHCAEAVATARRLIALDPDQAEWYQALGSSLYGQGESFDAVQVTFTSAWARVAASERPKIELADRANLAIVSGDFDLADTSLAKLEAAMKAEPSELAHYRVTAPRLELALERGRSKEAEVIAQRYLSQHAAWTPWELFDTSVTALDALYVSGGLARSDYIARREAWARGEDAHQSHSRAFSPTWRWAVGIAAGVRTEEDAREALTQLPATLPGPNARDLMLDEAIGRVQLAAGHAAEALPFLRRAAASCAALTQASEPSQPIAWVHASYELGIALEASGDAKGACAQYARIEHIWPAPRTDSKVTRAAHERALRLRCGL